VTGKRQYQGWGPGDQAEQHYLVQPRALAGRGDIRHVSEFLRASGWRERSRTGGPAILESPDRTIRVAYDPGAQPGGWTVHGRADSGSGEWSAHLSLQTPVEIVAGLTDALTRPRTAHAPDVWAPLREQHWPTRFEAGYYTATSPDSTAWVQYQHNPGDVSAWWCGAKDEQGNGWTATFTPSTPMHLVQALATELARPEPVMRPRGHVPHSTQIRTWSVSVTPSQLSAWQQARITAARAATWASNTFASNRARPQGPGARPYAQAGARVRR